MVFEAEQHSDSQWEAICSVAEKLGPTPETVRRVEINGGRKPGLITDSRERLKQLEREVGELTRSNLCETRGGSVMGGVLDLRVVRLVVRSL